jgi:hypothetical protein
MIHAVNRWAVILFGGVMILSLIFIVGVHGLPANFLTNYTVGLVITVPLYYLLAKRQVTRRPAALPEPART